MVRPRLTLPAGLQRETAAALLGLQPNNLSRYLNGTLTPGPRVADRLERMRALSETSTFAHENLWTMPRLAAWARAHRTEIDANPTALVQPLTDALGRLRFLEPSDQQFLLAAPGGTGDDRYNALIAGATQHWCTRLAISCPGWTKVSPLRREWVVYPDLERWSRLKSDPHLAALNIVLSTNSLDKA